MSINEYRICGTGWVLCDGKCWNCNKNAYVTTDHTLSGEEFVVIVGSPHTGGGIISEESCTVISERQEANNA